MVSLISQFFDPSNLTLTPFCRPVNEIFRSQQVERFGPTTFVNEFELIRNSETLYKVVALLRTQVDVRFGILTILFVNCRLGCV